MWFDLLANESIIDRKMTLLRLKIVREIGSALNVKFTRLPKNKKITENIPAVRASID